MGWPRGEPSAQSPHACILSESGEDLVGGLSGWCGRLSTATFSNDMSRSDDESKDHAWFFLKRFRRYRTAVGVAAGAEVDSTGGRSGARSVAQARVSPQGRGLTAVRAARCARRARALAAARAAGRPCSTPRSAAAVGRGRASSAGGATRALCICSRRSTSTAPRTAGRTEGRMG